MSQASSPEVIAYVGLGANLGNPRAQIEVAIEAISLLPGTRLEAQSAFYRSAPWGIPEQPEFVNAAVKISTVLSARDLLAALVEIEKAAGRRRGGRQWGPRLLDLDVLLYGNEALDQQDLTVPHPRMAERNFVLAPLLDMEPDLEAPGIGSLQLALAAVGRDGLARLDSGVQGEAIRPRIVVEGAPFSGTRRLTLALAKHFEAPAVVDDLENPFVLNGQSVSATGQLAAQLHALFRRQQKLERLRQEDLFSGAPILGFLPERSLLQAGAVLELQERKLFEQVAAAVMTPKIQADLVVYLQVSPSVAAHRQRSGSDAIAPYSESMLESICERYRDLFYDFDCAGVLTVNADHGIWGQDEPGWVQLVEKIASVRAGRHYFNPVADAI